MSTAQSRTQLPKSYSMKDVVYNLSRVGLMSAAFLSENWEMLRYAASDKMHENRRMKKLKELFKVRQIALDNRALMSTLSGSGSTFFNLCYKKDALHLEKTLKEAFLAYRVETLEFDNHGYEIIKR
jgi:homoserine kinase